MKLAIMQPYFMPYIGYFQLIAAVDEFVVLDDVNYINKGWINRNRILVNGQPGMFTLPLQKASQNKRVNEILIAEDLKWRKKFYRTIELSYRKAPYYVSVSSLVHRILENEERNLAIFVRDSLSAICDYMDIRTPMVMASETYPNPDLNAESRIIDICKKAGAAHYINLCGGKRLYRYENFRKHELNLQFIETMPYTYRQFLDNFIPHLSIIDVLMHQSLAEIRALLRNHQLV